MRRLWRIIRRTTSGPWPPGQVSPDEPLDTRSGERMIPVVAAMSRVENGTPARMDEVRAGWDLFAKYPV